MRLLPIPGARHRDAPGTADRLIEDGGDGVHLPGAPDQWVGSPAELVCSSGAQQPTRG